jgi:hypothetical protein
MGCLSPCRFCHSSKPCAIGRGLSAHNAMIYRNGIIVSIRALLALGNEKRTTCCGRTDRDPAFVSAPKAREWLWRRNTRGADNTSTARISCTRDLWRTRSVRKVCFQNIPLLVLEAKLAWWMDCSPGRRNCDGGLVFLCREQLPARSAIANAQLRAVQRRLKQWSVGMAAGSSSALETRSETQQSSVAC